MRIMICDDTLSMRFASIIKIIFSSIIVSVFVAYAFAQNTNRFSERSQIRTPFRYPQKYRVPTQVSTSAIPNVTPIRSDSIVNGEGSSNNFNSLSYFDTPDPRIGPPFSKKRTPPVASMPKEERPKVTPTSIPMRQDFKTPIAESMPPRIAYREVAPDSTVVGSRIGEKDVPRAIPMALRDKEETPQYRVEQTPLHTPPKPVIEEEMPETIKQVLGPEYKPEQKPEDTPFKKPIFLVKKKKEDEPEVPPYEGIFDDERATVPVEKEKSVAEETIAQTSWSIAAVEDKYPLEEEKATHSERKKKISPQPKSSISADFPKQPVNVQTSLTRGAFIQLASYTKQNDATSSKFVTKLNNRNNVFVYKIPSSQYYKLVVGPFKKDDVGVQLLRLNRKGFFDAFVLKKS